jgi:hypothetical protein
MSVRGEKAAAKSPFGICLHYPKNPDLSSPKGGWLGMDVDFKETD